MFLSKQRSRCTWSTDWGLWSFYAYPLWLVQGAACSCLSVSFCTNCDLQSSSSRLYRSLSLAGSSTNFFHLSILWSGLWSLQFLVRWLVEVEHSLEWCLGWPRWCSVSLSQKCYPLNLLLCLSKDSCTKFSRAVCLVAMAAVELGSTGIIGVDDSPAVDNGGEGGSSVSLRVYSCKGSLLFSTITWVSICVRVCVSVGMVVFANVEDSLLAGVCWREWASSGQACVVDLLQQLHSTLRFPIVQHS